MFKKETQNIPPPTTPKQNNFLEAPESHVTRQYKYIIYIEAILGINRLYLLRIPPYIVYISRAYSFLIGAIVMYFVLTNDGGNTASYLVFKYTATAEFLLLIGGSILLFHSKGYNFGNLLGKIDNILHISRDDYLTDSTIKRIIIWVSIIVIYHVIEFTVFVFYIDNYLTPLKIVLYIPIIAHECEQIFFCTLLRSILLRLEIIRGHVEKVLSLGDTIDKTERQKITQLSNNTLLDIMALHRVYESLHHCSEYLNAMMNFPILLMLISSGVSTTFMLKSFISLTQSSDLTSGSLPVIYFATRCIKYTLLVFTPCIYCNFTATHVKAIRTALYDAVNNRSMDRMERRRLKAFLQLSRDSEFSYALWGVIAINMSLPLSYISICTTYLVIVIQFSKFID